MLRDIRKARIGWEIWKRLVQQYRIDYHQVVLVLPELDWKWNDCAMRYLPDYMRRKSASKALILVRAGEACARVGDGQAVHGEVHAFSRVKMDMLLKYYCLHKFFDNIVFLYLDQPRDNYARLILAQGNVSMEEMVCLGFYQLREVPGHV